MTDCSRIGLDFARVGSGTHPSIARIMGDSAAAVELRATVERLAPSDAPVLITGETGTGKELVAKALHDSGSRHDGPFVAINCAAVPDALLEAELFGHEKGAFTGATTSRRGLLVQASGGTLFLDEIGELPMSMQAKLLRVLEQRTVRPVGGTADVSFDCRFLSATNRDLDDEVRRRRFRQDLLYRLDVLHVFVPPLRARGHDAIVLANAFVDAHSKRRGISFYIDQRAKERILAYDWPGNVRELQNAMESATAMADDGCIGMEQLPGRIQEFLGDRISEVGTDVLSLCSLEELERRHIARVLDATGGNKREAARILKVDRSTLYRKTKRYDL